MQIYDLQVGQYHMSYNVAEYAIEWHINCLYDGEKIANLS